MSWQRFVVLWVLASVILGPLVGRWIRGRRLELEATEEWDTLDFWDVPTDAAVRAARVDWSNHEGE